MYYVEELWYSYISDMEELIEWNDSLLYVFHAMQAIASGFNKLLSLFNVHCDEATERLWKQKKYCADKILRAIKWWNVQNISFSGEKNYVYIDGMVKWFSAGDREQNRCFDMTKLCMENKAYAYIRGYKSNKWNRW